MVSYNKNTPREARGIFYFYLELDLEVKTFLHTSCTNLYTWSVRNTSPLKVRILANISARIELGRTNTVGVLSNYECSFITEWT